MSRRRKGSPFGKSPKTLERYFDKIAQAESGDTAPLSVDETASAEAGSTDESLPNNLPLPTRIPKKKSKIMEILSSKGAVALGTVILLIGIGSFGQKLINSLNSTESRVINVEDKIEGLSNNLENKIEGLSKENSDQHESMNVSLARILEKFDRLFDTLKTRK